MLVGATPKRGTIATTSAGRTLARPIMPGFLGTGCLRQFVVRTMMFSTRRSSIPARRNCVKRAALRGTATSGTSYSPVSSRRKRSFVVSTLMAGPMVEARVIDLRYLPLDDEGLERTISSRTAA